jgi:hypothetical protein
MVKVTKKVTETRNVVDIIQCDRCKRRVATQYGKRSVTQDIGKVASDQEEETGG